MISNECSIEAFAEELKDKDSQTVIAMAVQEATEADRLIMKKDKKFIKTDLYNYSRQLKQLINYHRYAVKPHHQKKTTYNLYMRYWGQTKTLAEIFH